MCMKNGNVIKPDWIPTSLNIPADIFSKVFDFDDWSVTGNIFLRCMKRNEDR